MKFVVFGGTTEGRVLSHRLAELGGTVTVCVATEYGAEEQGTCPGVTILTGRKTAEEMAELVQDAAVCIDATHPYAVAVTAQLQWACAAAQTPYRRLLREKSRAPDGAIQVESAAAAAAYLRDKPGNILLSTGAKELAAYGTLPPQRLYPRILPTHEGIAACEALGIPHRNLLALQGPFSQALNEALFRQYAIAWVVTKDGGAAGGFPEKAAAAQCCGAKLVVLRRPEEEGATLEELIQACEEELQCR